jgi:hypothetical protein
MSMMLQCQLTRPSEKGRWITVVWLAKKLAVNGAKVIHGQKPWTVETVWPLEVPEEKIKQARPDNILEDSW